MMIIWCVVALAALGGLCIAIRARAIRGRKHPEVSSKVSAELIRRADQQNRWALRGDPRGVYGAKGAELMRSISPEPNIDTELDRATAYPRTAAVACTPENLATLLAEKLPCWRWAAFVSVLVQRRAELESRLYDNQLGYGAPSGERAPGGTEVGRFKCDLAPAWGHRKPAGARLPPTRWTASWVAVRSTSAKAALDLCQHGDCGRRASAQSQTSGGRRLGGTFRCAARPGCPACVLAPDTLRIEQLILGQSTNVRNARGRVDLRRGLFRSFTAEAVGCVNERPRSRRQSH
jgi:hypothetical protein